MKFNGEGIQPIALLTDDLIASVDALQMAGVPLNLAALGLDQFMFWQ